MPKPKSKTKRQSKTKRHKFGPLVEHSFEDGTYQVCLTCGRVRFKGDRYTFPRSPCTG